MQTEQQEQVVPTALALKLSEPLYHWTPDLSDPCNAFYLLDVLFAEISFYDFPSKSWPGALLRCTRVRHAVQAAYAHAQRVKSLSLLTPLLK